MDNEKEDIGSLILGYIKEDKTKEISETIEKKIKPFLLDKVSVRPEQIKQKISVNKELNSIGKIIQGYSKAELSNILDTQKSLYMYQKIYQLSHAKNSYNEKFSCDEIEKNKSISLYFLAVMFIDFYESYKNYFTLLFKENIFQKIAQGSLFSGYRNNFAHGDFICFPDKVMTNVVIKKDSFDKEIFENKSSDVIRNIEYFYDLNILLSTEIDLQLFRCRLEDKIDTTLWGNYFSVYSESWKNNYLLKNNILY
ncbi:MAG TPA: hypothetical protein PK453_01780 [Leptospiraceae bacterium]|nr:hypothetical protein [Leptospiraceae bacterium]HNF26682.1 hypothetical protein [Leptospiraceae bacterium]HNM01789.1 hypothetical protein [Leptospiraceae bacterium]HNN02939.1 hypothetical protein [Leptospiraceae bacterium]